MTMTQNDFSAEVASRRKIRWRAIALLFHFGALGCSSFERDWQDAVAELDADGVGSRDATAAPSNEVGFEGPWEGRWRSESDGHSGQLRCLLTPIDGSKRRYVARYKARWAAIFTFEYSLPIELAPGEGRYSFDGEQDLGWPWGIYRYQGTISTDRLTSRYQARFDRGLFELERVPRREHSAPAGDSRAPPGG